jgi:homoserine dehydrogenase
LHAGINLAMEASVCGGIPIHAVLREGISGDRVTALYGILNGTCNYILTEMEKRDAAARRRAARSAGQGLRRGRPQRGY